MQVNEKEVTDPESEALYTLMGQSQTILNQKVAGVRSVLVVLSARGIVFDVDALRQKVLLSYPDAAVFFLTTQGKPIGLEVPGPVDLLIDLTGPGQRQAFFFAKKMRGLARVAVGRKAGFFRKGYHRIYDEAAHIAALPKDPLSRERAVQKSVLALAGVAVVQAGDALPDRGKSIALELPPLRKN